MTNIIQTRILLKQPYEKEWFVVRNIRNDEALTKSSRKVGLQFTSESIHFIYDYFRFYHTSTDNYINISNKKSFFIYYEVIKSITKPSHFI